MRAARTWRAFDDEVTSHGGIPVYVFSDLPPAQQPGPYDDNKSTVEGFHAFRGLLSSVQTQRMLEFACKLPIYNKRSIEKDGFGMFGISTGQTRIADFDMAVGKELLRIPARLLPPPTLHYRNKKTINPFEASWNLMRMNFFAPAALKHVVVMDLAHSEHGLDLTQLPTAFQRALRELGLANVNVTNAQFTRAPQVPGENELTRRLRNIAGDESAPVLVVLPKHDYEVYSSIKRAADLQLGRHVVCSLASKMRKMDVGTLANVAMKFNLKGGGVNHAVEESHLRTILDNSSRTCQTIVIGADVAHPTGSARPGCPSIAAVVGSVDDNYLHYPGSMRLQLNRQEFIGDLRDMVKERLIDWATKHRNTLPANMLMYRDGVSESQYQIVREGEIPQLQDAFNDAYEYLNPGKSAKSNPPKFKLTFVVVGKRHNTRFFTDKGCEENSFRSDLKNEETPNEVYPGLEREEEQTFKKKFLHNGRVKWTRMNHNIRPGFVVDKVITHPYSEDFFLQSHMPLSGTGRSAHYFVLTNQMELSADDLQRATHALCYIYARATKGVSYCAPAYYADRLCDRGRAWFREYLTGHRFVPQGKEENFEVFKQRALDEINESDYWRHPVSPPHPQKYGGPRKNPWHPNLDNIMFYL